MTPSNSPGLIFDSWAKDERVGGMENEHWPFVKQAFDLMPSSSGNYLEIGVGSGYAIRYMATHQFSQARCLGIDVSSGMAERAKERCRDLNNVIIEHADFLTGDFSDYQNLSVIFSMEVFYYFSNIQKGIDKAYSLLNPGGQLWVLVDYYAENKMTHDWPEKYQIPICLWSMADYRNGFNNAGFSKVEQRQFINLHEENSDPSNLGTLCTFGIKTEQAK